MTVLIAVVALLNLALGYGLAIYLGEATLPAFAPPPPAPAPAPKAAAENPETRPADTKPAKPIEPDPVVKEKTEEPPKEEAPVAPTPAEPEQAEADEPEEEETADDSGDETDLLEGIKSFREQLAQQKPTKDDSEVATEDDPERATSPAESTENHTDREPVDEEPAEDLANASPKSEDAEQEQLGGSTTPVAADDLDRRTAAVAEEEADEFDRHLQADEADEEEEEADLDPRGDPADDEVAAGIAAFREQLAVMKKTVPGTPAAARA